MLIRWSMEIPISCIMTFTLFASGMSDPLLKKMSRCGKSKSDSHICRNLHTTIRTFGKILPVKISHVTTMYRLSRRKPKRVKTDYPVIFLSDWAECSFDMGGHVFLGGNSMDDIDSFGNQLVDFWCKFKQSNPDFGFFADVPKSEWCTAIPIALHGDECRGRQKQPVMVMAAQTLIPLKEGKSNMTGPFGLYSFLVVYYIFIDHKIS